MNYLFESSDVLNTPIECFYYNPEVQPFPVKMHWHYFMELVYISDGCAEMRSGENKYILSKGDMIIFNPKSVHGIYAADDCPLKYAVIKFDINCLTMTSAYTPKLRSVFHTAEKRGMSIVFRSEDIAEDGIGEIFSACIQEMSEGKYGCGMVVRARLYELLTKLVRHWQAHGFSVDGEVFAEDDRYNIHNITEYIDENLSDGISVADIAKKCSISYSYFAKKFLEIYGKSCKEYIEQMRLFKVEELLLYTDFDLNYIAQETGYSDCSHMIKSFRRSRGITPKQYRISRKKSR